MTTRSTLIKILAPLAFLAILAPQLALAQSDLKATIRAELLKDPRSAQMSPAQLDAMVELLANGAQKQGITAYDITWRPNGEKAASLEANPECGSMPGFLCTLNKAFGFDGSNVYIPLGLLITSGLLAFLLIELLHHHRAHERALAAQKAR
ncbi:MAG: hypothetical protein JOZ85_12350 [Betaproteobacteria bacterium]|nr:hypothetical protein [Betaproteobacteria bacterium]